MDKKEKCSTTQTNRIVIHKNDEEKRIYIDSLDTYLQDGWKEGISEEHRKTLSSARKGMSPWNKGSKGIMKSNQSMWKKGHIPSNKGKHQRDNISSEMRKEIISYYSSVVNSISECAKKFDISRNDIYLILKENNALRSHKEASNNRSKEKIRIKVSKDFLTKKKNNSFNTSKPEELLYEELLKQNINKTIYRQYKDEKRYPFYCDFYILEDDLFIELNVHWSHGGHPFDKSDPKDQEKLKQWQEKAKVSQFYANAIETWTIRDVQKQKIAKENNLNYKVIY